MNISPMYKEGSWPGWIQDHPSMYRPMKLVNNPISPRRKSTHPSYHLGIWYIFPLAVLSFQGK